MLSTVPGGAVATPNNVTAHPLSGFGSGVGGSYIPSEIRHIYGFDKITFKSTVGGVTKMVSGDGSGQKIAIIDAFDDPSIQLELNVFDQAFGLPAPVFSKQMPGGQPKFDADWAVEIALDVEWAHAIAPKAEIMLVEAKSASMTDLLNAAD